MLQLLTCPTCRARLDGTADAHEPCRRCGSDLSSVRHAYAQARRWRARARSALAVGRVDEALACARRAVACVDAKETRATLVAALVASDMPSVAIAVLDGSEPRDSRLGSDLRFR